MNKELSIILSLMLGLSPIVSAGTVTHTDYTSGASITAALQNTNENAIVNEINGNLDSTNIKAAGIAYANLGTSITPYLVPTGTIFPYGGSSAPTGYLLCHGQAVSRATYAALFAVVGTSFGTGDGSTTFNLPDMSSATVMGATWSGDFATIGASTGSANVAISATSSSESSHTHTLGTNGTVGSLNSASQAGVMTFGGNGSLIAPLAGGGETGTIRTATTSGGSAHSHTVAQTVSNYAPSIVVNFIIKT